MERLCGGKEERKQGTSVNSDTNFFRVTFMSNDIYDGTGFKAEYDFRTFDGRYRYYSIG